MEIPAKSAAQKQEAATTKNQPQDKESIGNGSNRDAGQAEEPNEV